MLSSFVTCQLCNTVAIWRQIYTATYLNIELKSSFHIWRRDLIFISVFGEICFRALFSITIKGFRFRSNASNILTLFWKNDIIIYYNNIMRILYFVVHIPYVNIFFCFLFPNELYDVISLKTPTLITQHCSTPPSLITLFNNFISWWNLSSCSSLTTVKLSGNSLYGWTRNIPLYSYCKVVGGSHLDNF